LRRRGNVEEVGRGKSDAMKEARYARVSARRAEAGEEAVARSIPRSADHPGRARKCGGEDIGTE